MAVRGRRKWSVAGLFKYNWQTLVVVVAKKIPDSFLSRGGVSSDYEVVSNYHPSSGLGLSTTLNCGAV